MNRLFAQFQENAGILARRFVLSSHTVTRAAPHIRDANNVQRLWNYFVVASIPSWLIGLWSLGHQVNLAIASLALNPAPGWRAALLVRTGVGLDAFGTRSPMVLFDCPVPEPWHPRNRLPRAAFSIIALSAPE